MAEPTDTSRDTTAPSAKTPRARIRLKSEALRRDSETRIRKLEQMVERLMRNPPHLLGRRSGRLCRDIAGPGRVMDRRSSGKVGDFHCVWGVVSFFLCDISTSDLFDTSRVIQLVATLFFRTTTRQRRQSPLDWAVEAMRDALGEGRPHCWTSLMKAVGHFHGCRQSSSRAYDHVGEWRARYRAFVHDNDSFTLSPLQLATTFYQSLSDSSKRKSRPSTRLPSGPLSPTTFLLRLGSDPTKPHRDLWRDRQSSRVSPPATNTPTVDERFPIRRARWVDRATKWQQSHLWKDRSTWFSPAPSGHCTAERQSPVAVQLSAVAVADLDDEDWSSVAGGDEDPEVRVPISLERVQTRPLSSVSASMTRPSCPPADPVGRMKEGASSSVDVEVSSSNPQPTAPASDADLRRLADDSTDSAFDAVEDVPSYADAASRMRRYWGPEVSDTPLIDVDDFARPAEPAIVRARNIIAWTLPSGRTLRCLVDSGSEVDLVDQDVVRTDPSFTTSRLTAPLHLRLGTRDKSDRCAVFANALFTSGSLDLGLRAFFICRVTAYDAILGLPFLKDTGMLVGWGVFTVARPGPSQPVAKGTHEWDRAVTVAPICSGSAIGYDHPGLLPDDEIIGLEPHNPLLDVVDDPALEDLSESEARTRLAALLEKYSDVFVDSLPMDRLPPYRPVNHEIPLIDPNEKVKPRVYPLADKYRSQWAEHSAKYTRGRFWVSGPIDSAAPVFAIPKKNSQTARFVIDLRARNSNTAKRFSPIPDMTSVRYEVARSRYRSKFDVPQRLSRCGSYRARRSHGFATVTGTYTSRIQQIRVVLKVVRFLGRDHLRRRHRGRPGQVGAYPTVADSTQQDRVQPHHRIISAIDVVALERGEQQAFDTVKSLVPATLRPIDGAKVTSGEHKIYLFTDASRVGIGLAWPRAHSRRFGVSGVRAALDRLPLRHRHRHQALRTIKTQSYAKHPGTSACVSNSAVSTSNSNSLRARTTPLPIRCHACGKSRRIAEDQVKENELEDMFFDGERHGFTTHGESLPEERPYTSPSPDRLPPVDFAFGPQRDDCEAGSPGYYALKDESQDEDVNGRDLGNLFLKEECHEFTTPGSPGSHRLAENIMDAVDSSTAAADEVNDAPVVHRPPDPLPQPFLDASSEPTPTIRKPKSLLTTRSPIAAELVLSEIHRSVGHAGHRITLAAIRPLYWWSSMSADCAKFCHSCEDCARGKASTQVPYGRLHPMPIPSGPWNKWPSTS
ncbi:BZ3500_MvSof-1268-A1-R1_C154g00800 [Microbotryum saponariae]|uniref:BZ3500_MvSof-1268-A1-R1_C154g00800 protein n=1 Tax=Microbotryum saponariae TaxID=289078 RepID=A0A2X0K9X6_9BASI|nr:BZ3500_MvSof-1268-A1-R1_C154g00800 [Microbotryum saponariae]